MIAALLFALENELSTVKKKETVAMKYIFRFFPLFLFFCGCSVQEQNATNVWMKEEGKLKVLCTVGMLNEMLEEIGGEFVASIPLIKGDLDPHTYQLVKGDDEKLAVADCIFCNGLGLEHGASLREYISNSKKVFQIGNLIQQQNPEIIIFSEGSPDPHIWMDLHLWSRGIPFVVEILSEKDPLHAEAYQKNGEILRGKLQNAHLELQKEMSQVPEQKRYLVTSHDAFHYFARAYLASEEERENNSWQQRCAAPEGLAPESQLSTSDIRLILDHIKKYHIHVIFPELNVSRASIYKLLDAGREEGVELEIASEPLYGDSMGPPGSSGDTLIEMIEYNVRTIKKYFSQ